MGEVLSSTRNVGTNALMTDLDLVLLGHQTPFRVKNKWRKARVCEQKVVYLHQVISVEGRAECHESFGILEYVYVNQYTIKK